MLSILDGMSANNGSFIGLVHDDDVIMRGPVEPDKMTFDLAVTFDLGEDWIDEYEVYKIAPGPIEIDSKIFVADWTVHHTWFKEQSYIYGHRHAVSGARDALSILEPGYKGGCQDKIRATVEESIRGHSRSIRGHSERVSGNLECKVAANAGFFDMKTGECMGKVQKYALDYI